jgi:hypothetical protein
MLSKNPKTQMYKFQCQTCDYICWHKPDWSKHIGTIKHNAQKCSKMLNESRVFTCDCGNMYKHIQSYKEIFFNLIKQNN